MVEPLLRQFLEHPKRKLIVIIVTVVIGLLLLWPAVDNYFAATEKRERLNGEIDKARTKVKQATQLSKDLEQREEKLVKFEAEAMSKRNVEAFREQVVDMVRNTNCQMLRNNVSPDAVRQAELNEKEKEGAPKAGPKYDVVGRNYTITVKGTQANVMDLIDRIQARKGLIQVQSFSLKQATGDSQNMTTLDLTLLLLDLAKPKEGA